jgi:putative endonuclease
VAAWFYILWSKRHGTFHLGSTTNIKRRIPEHKDKIRQKITSKYDVVYLIHYEKFELLMDARSREYAVRRWQHALLSKMIADRNPVWRDLLFDLKT